MNISIPALLLCVLTANAHADYLLDFEHPLSGGALNDQPTLHTPIGRLRLDQFGSRCFGGSVQGGREINSKVLCLDDNGEHDLLLFDFNVKAISGRTELRGDGSIIIEALDASDRVIASFRSNKASVQFNLTANTPIRKLRIHDSQASYSGLDDLRITPSTLTLGKRLNLFLAYLLNAR